MVKSILNAIPIYPMQCSILPKILCTKMEKICRDFIWHGCDSDQKVHLINWKTIQEGKGEGGLGIQSLVNMNKALVGKMCWRAYSDPS